MNADRRLIAARATMLLMGAPASAQDPLRTTLPPITVTAQKEPEDPQKLPLSVTAVLKAPQFNANSSSIEFLDVEQMEFVRGAQSALFGRNALSAIINITSRRPSLKTSTTTGQGVYTLTNVCAGGRAGGSF